MLKTQILLYWAAIGFYVAGTILFITGGVFKKQRLLKFAFPLAAIGLIPHITAFILRWIQAGHFPYWGVYEVFVNYSLGLIILYLIFTSRKPKLRIIGGAILPLTSILIGIAIFSNPEVKEIPRTFLTYWLGVHISFAILAVVSALISAILAVIFLLKDRANYTDTGILATLPDKKKIDAMSYRFVAFTFIMLGIMIASGAVWAYKAWGRYWGWDPTETSSLIAWLIYALYLHLRVTMGWKGKKASYIAILALISTLFSYYGIPAISDSIHEHLKY